MGRPVKREEGWDAVMVEIRRGGGECAEKSRGCAAAFYQLWVSFVVS